MASVTTRIGPADRGRKMTLEEFREAEEQPGSLYELARGVLEVTEVPGDDHGQVVHNLQQAFSIFAWQNPGLIRRIGHGSDIRLIIPELESDRHPDLAIVFPGAPRDARGRQVPGLVVEVVSPGKEARDRDYRAKREEYLALGIGEYWIVDRFDRRVTVLVRREEGGDPAWGESAFRGDDPIVSTRLPGLAGRASDLWVDVGPGGDAGQGG